MKRLNSYELEKDIDAIPICKEGREAIKVLFSNHFGAEFKKLTTVKRGQVRQSFSKEPFLICGVFPNDLSQINMVYLKTGTLHAAVARSFDWIESCKVLANSLDEYYNGAKEDEKDRKYF